MNLLILQLGIRTSIVNCRIYRIIWKILTSDGSLLSLRQNLYFFWIFSLKSYWFIFLNVILLVKMLLGIHMITILLYFVISTFILFLFIIIYWNFLSFLKFYLGFIFLIIIVSLSLFSISLVMIMISLITSLYIFI